MRTHRFGRKLKLPSTIAIKHQIRMLMVEDALKLKNVEARGAESGVGRESVGRRALHRTCTYAIQSESEKSSSTSPLPAEAPARRLQVDA
jgi:hypothetical protein